MSTLAVHDELLESFAAQVGTEGPVTVAGSRTRWDHGGPLADDTEVLSAPAGVVEYRPEEMTVQVRAGTTVEALHSELAVAGQRTAMPERGGTVGGAVVVGENHLETLGRGPMRNAVLQVRYVSSEGRLVTGGGPTVKNVSGFNLPKLLVGSLGTLGLVAEVTLRTNPTPPTSRWLVADDADPFVVPDVLLAPGAVLWNGSDTWVLLEGHEADVAAEQARLDDLGSFTATDAPPALPPHRWSLPPADLRRIGDTAAGAFVASVGVGLVFADEPAPARTVPDAAVTVSRRMKNLFDPAGRLNPGRDPLRSR